MGANINPIVNKRISIFIIIYICNYNKNELVIYEIKNVNKQWKIRKNYCQNFKKSVTYNYFYLNRIRNKKLIRLKIYTDGIENNKKMKFY